MRRSQKRIVKKNETACFQIIPTRQGRTNPRVVLKPRSKFKVRKPIHRTGCTKLQSLTFAVASSAV